ncbi:helix-turn-helix domain-containing protein [Brucella anthropi]|uniref:helix-turn-helix domain-containing protein n=1 Tax=Brucella anthropi TaxID=529 RepID=UPI000494C55A|nr:helix-turn-helix domain-containing protein [Brucella anthropi]
MTAAQCRAARGLLDWTQAELARRLSMSVVTVRAFEKGGEMRASNLKLLKLIFEEAGVIFIHANEAGDGVRWAKPQPSE